jgi:phosphoserine phosphatase
MASKTRVVIASAFAIAAAGLASAAPAGAQTGSCPQLQRGSGWYGDNAARLQAVIDAAGTCRGNPAATKPFAVFDWDNTMIKNDISDQTIFWLLRNGKIKQPPRRDWSTTSRFMTRAGARALRAACGPLARPGQPLPTGRPTNASRRCADEILSFRKEEETTDGDAAFRQANARRMQPMYAWVGQIMRGYRPRQVRRFAAAARRAALRAPVGATWRVGSSDEETAWIRYYDQQRDLVATLKAAGIEPWIVSASPKAFADVWGAGIGIDRRHTLGVASIVRRGRLTSHLKGCGPIPDGRDTVMTYIDGKRCFINQEILGIGRKALEPAPLERRQVIGAGDATTDVTMVRDATGAHVVLNRNQPEIMCHAYANQDGRWLVNPMFIRPLPRFDEPYPCSTTGFVDARGKEGPVIGDDGQVIPDQADAVFGSG